MQNSETSDTGGRYVNFRQQLLAGAQILARVIHNLHSHGGVGVNTSYLLWSEVKHCRTELWVCRNALDLLLAAECEKRSSTNTGISQSDRFMQILVQT